MFRVGMKAVCVQSNPIKGNWTDGDAPVEGAIYTIARSFVDDEGDEVVHLQELRRGPTAQRVWGPDVGYGAYRFRPVVERKTDISIFTAMLTPKKQAAGV